MAFFIGIFFGFQSCLIAFEEAVSRRHSDSCVPECAAPKLNIQPPHQNILTFFRYVLRAVPIERSSTSVHCYVPLISIFAC